MSDVRKHYIRFQYGASDCSEGSGSWFVTVCVMAVGVMMVGLVTVGLVTVGVMAVGLMSVVVMAVDLVTDNNRGATGGI